MNILGMDIGWGEILIILVVALLVVGPDKLPEYARKTARFVRKFQRVTSNLTGEMTKAINLDDEGGQASNFKKDLLAIKKSLESDVAELKSTFDGQVKAISRTVESGTKDAAVQIQQNAREISDTFNTRATELKSSLDAQAKSISETVASSAAEYRRPTQGGCSRGLCGGG